MPLPKPNPEEKQTEFVDRCMTDPNVIKEFKDENQRLAVCYNIYRKK